MSNDREPGDAPPRVVLIGVVGSGKTTVGRLVADSLGVPLVEADDLIVAASGVDVAQLVITDDPRLEELWRMTALATLKPGGLSEGAVVTLGASAPRIRAVASALQGARAHGARIIELVADVDQVARREGLNAPRSLALGAPRAMLTRMNHEMREVYAPVVDLSIDTGGLEPQEVARAVIAAL